MLSVTSKWLCLGNGLDSVHHHHGCYCDYFQDTEQVGKLWQTKPKTIQQQRLIGKVILYAVLLLLSVIFIAPFIWMIITSLKTQHGDLPFSSHFDSPGAVSGKL